ncbi:MAG: Carbohydrate binding domain protein [Verrucomicrobia bacterium]|nr:Carbohydrate binding domain protein [Verrucomicrobiota bacterium]
MSGGREYPQGVSSRYRLAKVYQALSLAVSLGIGVNALAETHYRNLVDNGALEEREGGIGKWRLIPSAPGEGMAALSRGRGPEETLALSLDYPVRARPGTPADPLAAPVVGFEQEGIALNVSDPYILSFWIRGNDLHGRTVRVTLADRSGQDYTALSEALYATPEWKFHSFNFQWWLNKAPGSTSLQFTLGEYGTLSVADVSIVCASPRPVHYNPRVMPGGGKNLLPNGSFELGTSGWTTLGTRTGWGGGLVGIYGETSTDASRDGKRSLKIELGPGKSPETFADGWPTARTVQNSLLAANKGWLDTVPGQTYTLSAYMKADRAGVDATLQVRQAGDPRSAELPPAVKKVKLSQEWERYSFSVKAQSAQACIAVGPDITASPGTPAKAWLDSVQFEAGDQPTANAPHEVVEVGFDAGSRDHIFSSSDAMAVQVMASNAGAQAGRIKFHASIRDYFGKVVGEPEFTLDVPAASATQQSWALGSLGKGIFTVTIDWSVGGAAHREELRLASLEPYSSRDSIFGINHAPPSAELCRTIQKAGIGWSRDWSLNWGLLEPEPGHLSFAASDIQLSRLEEMGFNIVCLTPPLPSADWGSTAPDSVPAHLWERMSYLPKDSKLLLDFVRKAVEHNRGRVHVWEFLNEPIWTGFCLPQRDFNKEGANYVPSDYIKLLKQAYPVIKAADPEGRVIGGFAAQPWHFAQEFVDQGGLDFVDVFNIHNYGTFLPPESFIGDMERLSELMKTPHGRKPIWLTEYSYYGIDQLPWEPWSPPSESWATNLLLRDERQCADWAVRYNLILLAHGVEKIFYHSGVTGEPNSLVQSLECALLTENGEPRKLFVAQAVLARLLGAHCEFRRELAVGKTNPGTSTKGILGYAFQCGKRSVMPVWATEAVAKVRRWEVVIPRDVRALDAMGNAVPGTRILLDTSPVYLTSDSLTADELGALCAVEARPGASQGR